MEVTDPSQGKMSVVMQDAGPFGAEAALSACLWNFREPAAGFDVAAVLKWHLKSGHSRERGGLLNNS